MNHLKNFRIFESEAVGKLFSTEIETVLMKMSKYNDIANTLYKMQSLPASYSHSARGISNISKKDEHNLEFTNEQGKIECGKITSIVMLLLGVTSVSKKYFDLEKISKFVDEFKESLVYHFF